MTFAFPTERPPHAQAPARACATARADERPHARPIVCIDCRYVRERPSGIGALVRALVDGVPAKAPDVEFLLLKHPLGPSVLSTSANVRELVVPYEANGPVTLWALPRVVDLERISLFHATYNILPRDLHVPTVVTVHDLMWMSHPEWARSDGIWGRVETAFYRNGIRRALERGSRLVAVSRATADDIAAFRPQARERTVVISPGVPALCDEEPAPQQEKADSSSLVGEQRRYVLVVGQYAPYKNHQAALRAFAKAFGEQEDVDIVFVQRLGNGSQALMPVARELGVAERVHFFSLLPGRDLDRLYRNAMLLCHPSLHEGFGLPVVEAMARGCPVVASNRGALREVTAGAARIVDPDDLDDIAYGLHQVAGDPKLAAELRHAGRARAAALSWENYVNGHVALYREMLGIDAPVSGLRVAAHG